MKFNERLIENIENKYKESAEIFLFLVFRGNNPIDFFSTCNRLEELNTITNDLTRYGIIEHDPDALEEVFKLNRPLFVSEEVKEDINIDLMRQYFTKSFTGENYRNAISWYAKHLVVKFMEKYPYPYEDIVEATKEFMTDVVDKPEGQKFIPKFETFVNENLPILLEEKSMNLETKPKRPGENMFDTFEL